MRERFGYPDWLVASLGEPCDQPHADRMERQAILDRVLAAAAGCSGVAGQARNGYVSLMAPRRGFATIQATTKKRVDLGLRLDGVASQGRLEAVTGRRGDAIHLRIGLTVPDEVVEKSESGSSGRTLTMLRAVTRRRPVLISRPDGNKFRLDGKCGEGAERWPRTNSFRSATRRGPRTWWTARSLSTER